MKRIRDYVQTLSPAARRGLATINLVALALLLFGLLVWFAPAGWGLAEEAFRYAFLAGGGIALLAGGLCWLNRPRFAGHLAILAIAITLILGSFLASSSLWLPLAATLSIVLSVVIAVQVLPQNDFIVAAVLSLLVNAVIQLLTTTKPATPLAGAPRLASTVVQSLTILSGSLFAFFVFWSLRTSPFRVKMVLILGSLTIVPTALLASVNRASLQATLIERANQNLTLSARQLASAIDAFLLRNLDTVRIEGQLPVFEDFLGQTRPVGASAQVYLFEDNELRRDAEETLISLARKDPVYIVNYTLIDWLGMVQASTDRSLVGSLVLTREYFYIPRDRDLPYVSSVQFPAVDSPGVIHFSTPVRSASGEKIGVLDMVYSAAVLQHLLVRNSEGLGADVSVMLLDENNIILAHSSAPEIRYRIVNPPEGQVNALMARNRLPRLPREQVVLHMPGLTEGLQNLDVVPYFSGSFHPEEGDLGAVGEHRDQAGAAALSATDWRIVTFAPQNTLLAPVQEQTRRLVVINIAISLASILIAILVTQPLVTPILSLTRASERIAGGEIDLVADVQTQDEVGTLAAGFNAMTARLRELIATLEERVAERTRALERRALQLRAAAEVGRAAASLRDLNELLAQVTRLISERFGFYHVGIFLLDDSGEYAVLRAANSEGGQRMLARQHRLPVGERGIVGFVTAEGRPRIALDVGEDAVFLANPDLPETRSELALPLIVGGRILGALDVQSKEPNAFTEEDVATLQVLADQIAIAIENARLFEENREALESARRAYGEVSRAGWRLISELYPELGYIAAGQRVSRLEQRPMEPLALEAMRSGQPTLTPEQDGLYLPVVVRGQAIGVLRLFKQQGVWTEEEIATATQLAGQLGGALDSARLYFDLSRRARREQAISEIAARLTATTQVENILETTVQELGRIFEGSEIVLQLGSDHAHTEEAV